MNWEPTWSPDGRWLAFTSDRDVAGGHNIYRAAVVGSGDPERLAPAMSMGLGYLLARMVVLYV